MPSRDDVIEAIYATVGDPSGWDDVVTGIAAHLNTVTGTFYLDRVDLEGADARMVASFGHNTAAIAAYMDHYASVNPFDRDSHRFGIGEVVTEIELDRKLRIAGAFENSEYYTDWVRPQHLRHVVGSFIDRSEAGTLVAAFWRPGDAGAFSEQEKETFGRFMRHATRAVEVGAKLRAVGAEMETVLSRSSSAVFTLGRDGCLRQRNAAADALLGAATGLLVANKRLRTAVPQDQAALDRLIACAFDPKRVGWAENARVSIRRTDGAPPLAVRVMGCGRRFSPFAADRTASAVLVVEGFETKALAHNERLRRRFNLTAAQARLALALRKGSPLSVAASELGIGVETARSHLKAVFARTGTHRQAELVLLLQEFEKR